MNLSMNYLLLLYVILSVAILANPSIAQEGKKGSNVQILRDDGPMAYQNWYLVNIKCHPNEETVRARRTFVDLLDNLLRREEGAFILKIKQGRHVGGAKGALTVGEDTLLLLHIFNKTEEYELSTVHSCNEQHFIRSRNNDPVTLIPIYFGGKRLEVQKILTAVSIAASIVDPLVGAVALGGIPSKIAERVKKIDEVNKAISDALPEVSPLINPIELRKGAYLISNGLMDINVDVHSIQHSLLLGPGPFRDVYREMVELSGGNKIFASEEEINKERCNNIVSFWNTSSGIREIVDTSYILFSEVRRVTSSRRKLIDCIGRSGLLKLSEESTWNLVKPILPTHGGEVVYQPFTAAEIDEAEGVIRPDQYKLKAEKFMTLLIRQANEVRINQRDLEKVSIGELETEDETLESILDKSNIVDDSTSTRQTLSEVAKLFAEKGYRRFGCMMETDKLGLRDDGSLIMFLAFKADRNERLYVEDAIGVRLWFEGNENGKVAKVLATDNYTYELYELHKGCQSRARRHRQATGF